MLPSRACSRNPTFRPGGCGHWMSLLFRGNPPKATGGEAMVAMERRNTDFRAHCGICCFEWLRAAPSHTKGPYGFWEREVWTLWVSVLCFVCYSYLSMVEGNSHEISRIPQQQLLSVFDISCGCSLHGLVESWNGGWKDLKDLPVPTPLP